MTWKATLMGGLVVGDPHTGREQLYDYLERQQPAAVLVLDNVAGRPDLVHALCDRFPHLAVIARRFWPRERRGDDDAHAYINGKVWADGMHAWLDGDTRPWVYWDNEPVDGRDDALIAETLRAYERAARLGLHVVGPNWGTRWPPDEKVSRYRDIYRGATQFGHHLGLHVYGALSLRDDVVVVTPQGNWHLSEAFFTDRIDAILQEEPDARFVVTEFGTDRYPQVPGSGPYRRLMSGEEFARQHHYAGRYFTGRPVDAVLTYCWSSGDARWRDYAVRDDRGFVMAMPTLTWAQREPLRGPARPAPAGPERPAPAGPARPAPAGPARPAPAGEGDEAPEPKPEQPEPPASDEEARWELVEAVALGAPHWQYVNVRQGPGTGTPVVGHLRVGDVLERDANEANWLPDGDGTPYRWVPVRSPTGYVREDVVKFRVVELEPEPQPEPPAPPAPTPEPPEQPAPEPDGFHRELTRKLLDHARYMANQYAAMADNWRMLVAYFEEQAET